jgi:hypothetical protein
MTDRVGYHTTHAASSAKVLFIDSKDANAFHAGSSHFTYVFRDAITVNENEGVLISLLQASIPYSFYNIRPGVNDKIDIQYGAYSTTPTLTDALITMPPGNYTAISLANAFTKLLETELHNSLRSKVTMEYDRNTQKFNFSIKRVNALGVQEVSTGIVVVFNLTHGAAKQSHFDVEIGFDSDTASSSLYFGVDTSTPQPVGKAGSIDLSVENKELSEIAAFGGILPSTNIADLNGSVHALYLRTNLPVISSMDSLTGGTSQIIAKIPIDTMPGGIIFHEPKNSIHKSLIHSKSIKDITIRLTDDRNRVIDTNGLHISVALMFEFVSLRQTKSTLDARSETRKQIDILKKNIKKRYNAKNKNNSRSNPKPTNVPLLPN